MEVQKLKTVEDLLQFTDERIELIDGEIVKRPMVRSEHALIQSCISDEVVAFKERARNNFPFSPPMHPAWRRCKNST